MSDIKLFRIAKSHATSCTALLETLKTDAEPDREQPAGISLDLLLSL
ncbi:MAG: hypothetical protein K2X51_10370 [Burkholderiales bacterium]|nr:hypothetical protein [Burkholderiales bacterium]